MTGPRFLALDRSPAQDPAVEAAVRAGLQRIAPSARLFEKGSLLIGTTGEPVLELPDGLVIGALFDRRFPGLVSTVGDNEAQRIVRSRGQRLIDGYWGGYVALLAPPAGPVDVLRAPFGELPCYHVALPSGTAFASDPGILVACGLLRPRIAWPEIVRELGWHDLRGSATCLEGLEGQRGGERLTPGTELPDCTILWNPWNFARPGDQGPETLEELVRRSAGACVAARTSQFDRVLLMLSGGLDSSIVAACLAAGRRPFDLVTFTTCDAPGDERDYGRLMARHVNRPLHEHLRDVARIDPDFSPAARLPRPAGRLFEQESRRIIEAVARETGAGAVLTGGGGDNVFCALQSAAPVADRMLVEGIGRGALATAREIGRIAPASVAAVLRAAVGRLAPWHRQSPVQPDLRLLAPAIADAVATVSPHPWIAAPRGALPGAAAHIKLLAYAESFAQGHDPEAPLQVLAPLLSQPLVETCLAVPSWNWFQDGRSRAIARRAFARALPEAIAQRRSKGTPDSFVAEIYERYRPQLRDRLLGGALAAHGLIDLPAVARTFDEAGSIAPADYRRLMRLVDVENWVRAWAMQGA